MVRQEVLPQLVPRIAGALKVNDESVFSRRGFVDEPKPTKCSYSGARYRKAESTSVLAYCFR